MKKKIIGIGLILVMVISIIGIVPGIASAAGIIYVDADAMTGANDGTSWADAYTDLQDALSAASSGDEIRVAQGTYYPGTSRTDSFAMKNGVAIYGGYAGYGEPDPDDCNVSAYPTILSGDIGTAGDNTDNCYHVFYHPSGTSLTSTAVLDGFIIIGGNADGSGEHLYGGGMYNDSSSPTVTNCTFNSNLAFKGGGMYNYNGSSPTVTDCAFNNNSAGGNGGGMSNYEYSSPVVTNSTFSSNSAGSGGGMYNYDSSMPTVTDCAFNNNSAEGNGGGMYNYDSLSPAIINCTFNNNSAVSYGGGMYNYEISSPTVTGCTFSSNSAGSGGGMYNDTSSPTVTGCTFSSNSAGSGGGMYNNFLSSPTVTNCTFNNNSAGGYGGGMFNLNNSSPTVTGCTFNNNSAEGNGGGMYNNNDSSPTVTNSTFSNNSAGSGGGMYNYHSSPTVTNCTFFGNSASSGSGMYNDTSSPTVTNCILWDEIPYDIYNADMSSSPVVTYCDILGGYEGAHIFDDDPLLDGSLHLQAGSPCIDAGNNAAVPSGITTDFEGDPRFLDYPCKSDTGSGTPPIVDIGADEYVPVLHTIIANAGAGGTISPSGDVMVAECDEQTFTIMPDAGYSIADVFVDSSSIGDWEEYTFTNVDSDHTIEAIFVLLSPNNPPVANDDAYSTTGDATLNVSAPGVLLNDTDADGDDLVAFYPTDPDNGSVTLNADGSFSYTPDFGFRGEDSFTYTASDGEDESNTATITITVNPTELEQVLSRLDDIEADIIDILANVGEMSGGIDYLKEMVNKVDIDFLFQLDTNQFTIFHMITTVEGLPVVVAPRAAFGMRPVVGEGLYYDPLDVSSDITENPDVWFNTAGPGHLRTMVRLDNADDYSMFIFVVQYNHNGSIIYGTCGALNENCKIDKPQ